LKGTGRNLKYEGKQSVGLQLFKILQVQQ